MSDEIEPDDGLADVELENARLTEILTQSDRVAEEAFDYLKDVGWLKKK